MTNEEREKVFAQWANMGGYIADDPAEDLAQRVDRYIEVFEMGIDAYFRNFNYN